MSLAGLMLTLFFEEDKGDRHFLFYIFGVNFKK